VYSPDNGAKVLRFNIASDQFIDLSSIAVSVNVSVGVNGEATPLVDSGHVLFNRLRWIISGTVVEDIEHFNVASQLFHQFLSGEKKENTEAMGFGGNRIAALSTKNILMLPKISGLCNQHLWLPGFALGSQGAVLELHIAEPAEVWQSGEGQIHSTRLPTAECSRMCTP
jgi:hypothetical protein